MKHSSSKEDISVRHTTRILHKKRNVCWLTSYQEIITTTQLHNTKYKHFCKLWETDGDDNKKSLWSISILDSILWREERYLRYFHLHEEEWYRAEIQWEIYSSAKSLLHTHPSTSEMHQNFGKPWNTCSMNSKVSLLVGGRGGLEGSIALKF